MTPPSTERTFVLGVPIRYVRFVTGILAVLVAGIHLLHPRLGLPRLVIYIEVGTLFDPRPLVFTLAGLAILIGIVLVYFNLFVKVVYLLGMVLMVVFIVGYMAWHTVLAHGAFWPHIHGHGHTDAGFIEIIWLHLAGDTIAMVSKFYELVLWILLAILLKYDSAVKSN